MKTAWILSVLLLPVLLVVAAIVLNRPPLFQPPGLKARLQTYLTRNVAETSPDSPFPELRAGVFPVPPDTLYRALVSAVRGLGWRLQEEDVGHRTLQAVVTSGLWGFKDDVRVRVVPRGTQSSSVEVGSSSRVGKGDLAANTRHVLDLLAAVRGVLSRQVPGDGPGPGDTPID